MPCVLALQIADITSQKQDDWANYFDNALIEEWLELHDHKCMNGIWVTTFVAERSEENYRNKRRGEQ